MAKDPAFLFYSQDFYTGTSTMSFEDKGKFITIMCLLHQKGRLNEETICFVVGSVSVNLKSKFSVDENGLWYNDRLEKEIEKRNNYTNSRRINGLKGGRPSEEIKANKHMDNHKDNHMGSHMGNENENEDKNNIIKRVVAFLNKTCGRDFKHSTPKTKSAVSARLNDGFSENDFEIVIENRFKEWGFDSKMSEYLRPETLFGSKFESYLQIAKASKPEKPQVSMTKTDFFNVD